MGNCHLSAPDHDCHFLTVVRVPADRRFNPAGWLLNLAVHQGQIAPDNRMFLNLLGQSLMGQVVFGHHQ